MAITRIGQVATLEERLQTLLSQKSSSLFCFFGSPSPASDQSWCSDCVIAEPLIRHAHRSFRPELDLIECPVGDRATWKDTLHHPYRQHPAWRLERIPTLILFLEGREVGRLVEADCRSETALAAFLSTVNA